MMFAELIFLILAIFVLILIDKFSTLCALIACVLVVHCYVYKFSYLFDKRVIITVISKVWTALLCCYRIIKQLFYLFRRIFLPEKSTFILPSYSDIQFCGDVASVETEINALVSNISRDFISSWYDKLSANDEFLIYLNSSINDTLVVLCKRVSNVDKKKMSYLLLQTYLNFFSHFVDAKKKTDVFKRENFEMRHWAVKDALTEWCYLQSLLSTLLDSFCPSENERSLNSKYSPLLHTLVVEILTENMLHPLINILSDPSHLNTMFLNILLKYVKTKEYKSIFSDNSQLHNNSYRSDSECCKIMPVITLQSGQLSEHNIFENTKTYYLNKLAPDCVNIDQIQQINPKNSLRYLTSGEPSAEYSGFVSGLKSSSNINLSDCNLCDTTIKRSRSADYIGQMPRLKALNENDCNLLHRGNNKLLVALKSGSNSTIEQAEEANETEVLTLFTDVKILDTMQENEAGLLPYTVYCIQYTGVFHDSGNRLDIPRFVKHVVNIKRRFREFVILHSKLEDNPYLKVHLKGIKGPSKWLVLPFSNLDKKNIAERKSFLNNYLKEICCLTSIAQSIELQEFLAYGDERTLVCGVDAAALYKATVSNPPDQVENTIIDAFFKGFLLDYSSREPEIKEHIRNYMKNMSCTFNCDDQKNSGCVVKKTFLPSNAYYIMTTESCKCPVFPENFFTQEESLFGKTIIELIAVVLDLVDTNLGDIISILKALLAPSIDSFFVTKIDGISKQHLITLLHMLHKFLWFNEEVFIEQNVTLQNFQIQNQIMNCLDGILSTECVMQTISCTLKNNLLEKFKLFLSSLQHQEANRCLLFHLFDVVIDVLCSTET